MPVPAICFKNYTWQYNAQTEPTLRGIDLTIRQGEKVLICGPSGCGKSTLAHALNGLIPFSYKGEQSGSLTVMGKETSTLSLFGISKMVGTVLQDTDGQFVGLTVAEDIAFALENDAVPQSELFARVEKTAKRVGLEDHLSHAPGELSGGQKQRVSLAGVMVDDVPIFLFDEPLANLDPAAGKAAIELIDEIQKSSGATVIIIEHRLEDVLHRPVDRVVLMNEGRIVSDSSPDALLSGSLLFENGIREPLYLSALKTAGVKISEDKRPSSLDTIALSEDDKEKLREWFCAAPSPAAKKERQVLLSVKDLGFSYSNGRRALDDISLEVYKGEMLAVVGRNGAGKSTLSKLICGFEKPCEGSISLDGADLSGLSIKERAERIGYVMQNPNQMICKTMIYEETALGLVTRGVPEDEIKERVSAALKTCGLYPFRNWPVSALSFGQKKRLTIASILAIGPEIIILDEPTAGQDYRHYTEIMEFLRDLAERGITVIMITHDMHLMLEYCERTLVLTDGRLIADDEPWNILTDQSVIEAADLKETSLCGLARLCGIEDGRAFTASFIDGERRQRHGQHI